jgi:hypothetical protein
VPSKRHKGPAFEREMATAFSLWWTDGERDDIFWRTDGSGGRATNRARKGKTTRYQYGDMTFTDPIGKPLIEYASFEFKFHKKFSLLGVLHNVDFQANWMVSWAKAWRDAEISQRNPVLVTKQNQGQPVMWVTREMINGTLNPIEPSTFMKLYISERTVEITREKDRKKRQKVQLPQHTVHGFLLEEFFKYMERERFEDD